VVTGSDPSGARSKRGPLPGQPEQSVPGRASSPGLLQQARAVLELYRAGLLIC